MEDILASIRRILSEDEAAPVAPTAPPPVAEDDVLVLDASMRVDPPGLEGPEPMPPEPALSRAADPFDSASAAPLPVGEAPSAAAPQPVTSPAVTPILIAPEAAAAAASVDSMVRGITTERGMLVHAGGPTIEDIVRAELRPLLKQWLDTHLPPMVERLVRAELERVIGRAVP